MSPAASTIAFTDITSLKDDNDSLYFISLSDNNNWENHVKKEWNYEVSLEETLDFLYEEHNLYSFPFLFKGETTSIPSNLQRNFSMPDFNFNVKNGSYVILSNSNSGDEFLQEAITNLREAITGIEAEAKIISISADTENNDLYLLTRNNENACDLYSIEDGVESNDFSANKIWSKLPGNTVLNNGYVVVKEIINEKEIYIRWIELSKVSNSSLNDEFSWDDIEDVEEFGVPLEAASEGISIPDEYKGKFLTPIQKQDCFFLNEKNDDGTNIAKEFFLTTEGNLIEITILADETEIVKVEFKKIKYNVKFKQFGIQNAREIKLFL